MTGIAALDPSWTYTKHGYKSPFFDPLTPSFRWGRL